MRTWGGLTGFDLHPAGELDGALSVDAVLTWDEFLISLKLRVWLLVLGRATCHELNSEPLRHPQGAGGGGWSPVVEVKSMARLG